MTRRKVMMLYQGLVFANGKGGVGKTSVAVNVAAVAAVSGWRTLVVDLDPQGNAASDLGVRQRGLSDDGESLFQAVQFNRALQPLPEVRPNLDFVPAGRHTASLGAVLSQQPNSVEARLHLARVLAPLSSNYDLVVFDCPPGDTVLGDMALAAGRGLVVPVRFDGGSLDGLEVMAERFASVKGGGVNPALELLGVVLFDFTLTARTLRTQVEQQLSEAFHNTDMVFPTAIRHSQRAAFDMRNEGLPAIDYEVAAEEDRVQRFRLLRAAARRSGSNGSQGPARSQSAQGLAEDYVALTGEILAKFGLVPVEVGEGAVR